MRFIAQVNCMLLLSGALCLAGCSSGDSSDASSGSTSSNETDDNYEGGNEEANDPPSNSSISTSGTPSSLSVYASDASSGTGTDADIKLSYVNKTGSYACTITGGVPRGTTKSCTPTSIDTATSITTNSDYDDYYISYASKSTATNDSLRFSTISVKVNGTTYSFDQFDDNDEDQIRCSSCNAFFKNCGSCWLDGDGSDGPCVDVRIPMGTSRNVDCKQSNASSSCTATSSIGCVK